MAPMLVFEYYQQFKENTQMNPVTKAMLYYSIEHEAACKPVDFFVRRTGALFFDIGWVKKEKKAVISEMKQLFNWSEEATASYTQELEQLIDEAVYPTK